MYMFLVTNWFYLSCFRFYHGKHVIYLHTSQNMSISEEEETNWLHLHKETSLVLYYIILLVQCMYAYYSNTPVSALWDLMHECRGRLKSHAAQSLRIASVRYAKSLMFGFIIIYVYSCRMYHTFIHNVIWML